MTLPLWAVYLVGFGLLACARLFGRWQAEVFLVGLSMTFAAVIAATV